MSPSLEESQALAFPSDQSIVYQILTKLSLEERQVCCLRSIILTSPWSFEATKMFWAIFQVLKPTVVVETGTHHGASASFFWLLSREFGFPLKIYTFDLVRSPIAEKLWTALGAQDDIVFTQGNSAPNIRPVLDHHHVQTVDFAFIDGDHTYQGEPISRRLRSTSERLFSFLTTCAMKVAVATSS